MQRGALIDKPLLQVPLAAVIAKHAPGNQGPPRTNPLFAAPCGKQLGIGPIAQRGHHIAVGKSLQVGNDHRDPPGGNDLALERESVGVAIKHGLELLVIVASQLHATVVPQVRFRDQCKQSTFQFECHRRAEQRRNRSPIGRELLWDLGGLGAFVFAFVIVGPGLVPRVRLGRHRPGRCLARDAPRPLARNSISPRKRVIEEPDFQDPVGAAGLMVQRDLIVLGLRFRLPLTAPHDEFVLHNRADGRAELTALA